MKPIVTEAARLCERRARQIVRHEAGMSDEPTIEGLAVAALTLAIAAGLAKRALLGTGATWAPRYVDDVEAAEAAYTAPPVRGPTS